MANGVLLGSGTQTDPWIVEDGFDLNALRNLPTTTWQWVEITKDINLGIFSNWIPIPTTRLNINGRGHTISGLRITGNLGQMGLFAQLETLETKNIRIEAEITHSATSTSDVGILCGRLVGGHFGASSSEPLRTAVISNIQCFGNISVTVTGATQPTGGCFGSTWGEAHVSLQISDCAFYGSISCHITASSSTAPSSSQLRTLGGILGTADARGSIANYTISLINCISVTQFVMLGGAAHSLAGGIIGAVRAGTAPNIMGCVVKNKFLLMNTHQWTQTLWLGGIVGGVITDCSISMCAAHSEIIYDPSESIAVLNVAGFQCMRAASTGSTPVTASYAVMDFKNPKNAVLPASRSMRGIGAQAVATNTFFDSQVLAEGWSEAVTNPECGRTTAQLKDRAFLESQGWVFANV